MPGDFPTIAEHIIERVGAGNLQGNVLFDQVYAQAQHERLDYFHEEGEAKFLENALFENHPLYMQYLADAVLDPNMTLNEAMVDCMEDLSNAAEARAPKSPYRDLSNSGSPIVTDQGAVVYRRPPKQGRLSQEEIRAKRYGHH